MNCPALKTFFVLFFLALDFPDACFDDAISAVPLVHTCLVSLKQTNGADFKVRTVFISYPYHKFALKSSDVTFYLVNRLFRVVR